MTMVGIAVGIAAAGCYGGGGTAARQGAIDPPMMLVRVAFGIWVVCWAPIPARCTHVGVINIITMSVAVVSILPTLVRSGRVRGLLCAGTVATKPGWLLWETTTTVATTGTTVVVASAVASVAAIVECVLLLCRGIDVGWGLLADSHAELLDVC